MKIQAGFARGMNLASPVNFKTRPTAAKVRSAILNSFQFELPESRLLDLFAGVGCLGLEALSRGAASCTFVENDRQALKALSTNLSNLKERAVKSTDQAGIRAEIVSKDVNEFLKSQHTKINAAYDLIWADPPYQIAKNWLGNAFSKLHELSSTGNFFILECQHNDISEIKALGTIAESSHWELSDTRKYGETGVMVWTLK